MNNRFKFRIPYYKENMFVGFVTANVATGESSFIQGCSPKEPEQCTGLKDKNGNLIYEGDVVEYESRYWAVFYSIPTMEWGLVGDDYSVYGNKMKRADTYVIDCEIIGNIHENGDLLK